MAPPLNAGAAGLGFYPSSGGKLGRIGSRLGQVLNVAIAGLDASAPPPARP